MLTQDYHRNFSTELSFASGIADCGAGLHRGSAEKLPDGAICITLEWDDPLGGIGTDVFYSPAPDLLYVDSTILMSGKTVKYRTVYNKQ